MDSHVNSLKHKVGFMPQAIRTLNERVGPLEARTNDIHNDLSRKFEEFISIMSIKDRGESSSQAPRDSGKAHAYDHVRRRGSRSNWSKAPRTRATESQMHKFTSPERSAWLYVPQDGKVPRCT